MDRYTPHLLHAVLLVFIALGIFIGSDIYLAGNQFIAVTIVSLVLLLFSVFVMAWINTQQNTEFYLVVGQLAEAISKLERDQWQALGIRYPTLRIKWDGHPIKYIEDSEITLEEFSRFMNDSTSAQISPRRNWTEKQDIRTWQKIYQWLLNNEYIKPDSASGQHAALWKGQAFFTLRERYLDIPVVQDEKFMTGAPATPYS